LLPQLGHKRADLGIGQGRVMLDPAHFVFLGGRLSGCPGQRVGFFLSRQPRAVV